VQTENNIESALNKLKASQRCHPNAVQTLIEEAIEFLEIPSPRITEQDATWYAHSANIATPNSDDVYLVEYSMPGLHGKTNTSKAVIHYHPSHGWRSKVTPMFVGNTAKDSAYIVKNMIGFRAVFSERDRVTEQDAREIELSDKAQARYQTILDHQDWIKTDFDRMAIKAATKINVDMDVGLIDYYPATILAKMIAPNYSEIDRLRDGIAAIVKTVKPLSNFDGYQVLAMSPHQLINHVNALLDKLSAKPESVGG